MRKRPASRLLNIMWISKKRPRAKERGRSSVRDSHALRIQVHRPNTQVFYRLATFLEPVCFCAIIVTCNKTTHSCPRYTWKSTPSCLFRNHSPSSTRDTVGKGRALLLVCSLFISPNFTFSSVSIVILSHSSPDMPSGLLLLRFLTADTPVFTPRVMDPAATTEAPRTTMIS